MDAVTFAETATWGRAEIGTNSKCTNVILSRQLTDSACHLQFKKRREDLRRSQLALQAFQDFVDLERLIRAKNLEDDRLGFSPSAQGSAAGVGSGAGAE